MTTVNVKGVGKVQFPDSMSRDEIRTVLRQRFSGGVRSPEEAQGLVRSRIRAGGRLSPEEVRAASRALPQVERPDDDLNTLQRFNVGLGSGLQRVGEGIAQAGLEAGEAVGLVRPGRAQQFTQDVEQERETFNRFRPEGVADDIGEIAGEALPFLAVPGGQALAGGRFAATAAGRAGLAGAEGAAIGGLQFRREGESRLTNTGVGAAAGGAGSLALSGAAAGFNAARQGLRRPADRAVAELSDQFEVPASAGDIRQNLLSRVEQNLERVPFVGTRRFRRTQSTKAGRAAERFLRGEARDAPEDVGPAIRESVETRLSALKGQAKQKYDDVARLAGNQRIQPDNAREVAVSEIFDQIRLPGPLRSQSTINLLGDIVDSPELTFQDLRLIRTRLNRKIADSFKGAVADEDVRPLIALKEAVEKDINQFARRQGGELADALEEANSFYRNNLALFKNPRSRIARVFKSEEPDQLFNEFIKKDRTDRARLLFNNMTEEGRQAVRANIVREAYEAGLNTAHGEPFSPAKFAQRLDQLGAGVDVFFKGRRKQEIQGLKKLMEHIKRAGQFNENPPTGQRITDALLVGGAVVGSRVDPVTTGAVAAGMQGLTWLTTTRTGRNLLLASSRFQPGSKGMRNLTRRIEQAVPRVSALAATSGEETPGNSER